MKNQICSLGIALSLLSLTARADGTNGVSTVLTNGTINWGIWGTETNLLCAGIVIHPKTGESKSSVISVYVLTSNANVVWDFLLPPKNKIGRLELRDSDGKLILKKWSSKKMDDELPETVKREGLPVSTSGVFENEVMLRPGEPARIADLHLEDIFQIKSEGDYTLSVRVTIYRFTPDRKIVFRMDLPCLNTTIHLKP